MSELRKRKSSRERVQDHRARMRRQGLRLVQIWAPDVGSPDFAAQAHAQSLSVAESSHSEDDQAFIDWITASDNE